jgi:hypothetical protein
MFPEGRSSELLYGIRVAGRVFLPAFSRSAASFARSFAIRPINLTGTGWQSGKRMVPLLTLYAASSSRKAAATPAVTG